MSEASSVLTDDRSNTSVIPKGSGYVAPVLGKWRKVLLLSLFCFAEFMDAFIVSSLFPAIVALENGLRIRPNEVTWEFAAYSATFAAFLLISGRISDLYSSKWTFIVGSAGVGLFSLGCGLVHEKVGMFILRAFAGISAALTVPSALSLIIEWFPEPAEQQQGIALFGGGAAIGNVLGVILGAMLVEWASWRWIFYVVTMMGVPIAIISIWAVPAGAPHDRTASFRRLDLPGVSLITAAMVLFVYAVTSGPASGWGTANVIAPLTISIALAVAFFIVEYYLPKDMAALPPDTWFYPNFGILAAIGLLPFFWWASLFFQLVPLYQEQYGWSTVVTAVHFLPTGVFGGAISTVASSFVTKVNPKWSILGGLVCVFIGSMILPFANTSAKYWSHTFPAFTIGTLGNMTVFINANIAIFMNTPPEIAGTVGAVFNTALQLGISLGLACLTSIQESVDKKRAAEGHAPGYQGKAASFWFLLAWVAVTLVAHIVFYKIDKKPAADTEAAAVPTSASADTVTTAGAVSEK